MDKAGQIAEITKEATALAILNNHPHILTYVDSFPAGNFFCIVTEYCEVCVVMSCREIISNNFYK